MAGYILRKFYPDEVIFKAGATGASAFLLKEGTVEIYVEAGDSKMVLAHLSPVAIFGEMAVLLADQKRSASARALTYCEVMEINREAFDEFVEKAPTIVVLMLKALAARLIRTNAKLMKAPVLFVGVCEILGLMVAHERNELNTDQTVRSVASALNVETTKVRDTLKMLENEGLIETRITDSGHVLIRIPHPSLFLLNARKLYRDTQG